MIPLGVMGNELDCDIVINKFDLQSYNLTWDQST